MKSPLFLKFMILAAALLLPISAFAGSVHKGSLQVSDPVQVNGKQLPAGEYTVTWNGDSPNVSVNITRDGKVMATATAKLVPLEQKAQQDAAEMNTSSTGSRTLTVIRFSGQKYQLELNAGAGQDQGRSGDSLK